MITGGKSFVSSAPAFSNDGKKLLVCTGNTVSIFSTSTGLKMMQLEGHKELVTSVNVVPASSSSPGSKVLCFCWTSSLDGNICYWDFSLPELIKKVDVRLPIFSMVIPNAIGPAFNDGGKPPNMFAFISVKDPKKPDNGSKVLHGQVWQCNLSKSSLAGAILAETRNPEFITISPSGEFFGICNKRKVHIWMILAGDSNYNVKKIKLHHTKNLSVLAFHPSERIVAAGDTTGRILIWRGFGNRTFSESGGRKERTMGNDEERPGVRGDNDAESCSVWHWHPTGIKVLRFSSDGAYLYSGGKEGVLVVWQLEIGNKKFLPHIGAPILYFTDSRDPTLSSISCADNQIHLLKMPSMQISKSISGIKPSCSFPEINNGVFNGLAFDNSAGLVAVHTENYCLQFYNLSVDREISQLHICERNHQPEDDITLVVTVVTISMDGSKLGTAEVQLPEEGLGGLVCLKFWDSGYSRGDFSLSTVIYEPHSDAGISAIAFHPTRDMAVTSSYGGNFKIWVRSSSMVQKDFTSLKSGWRCHSVGSHKNTPMTAAAFSADGSVLAVAAETVITLWDPHGNVLVAVIGETFTPIIKLSFVGKSEYLVSLSRSSRPQLSVWNLAKLSLSWSYKLTAEAVATSNNSFFAVLALIPELGDQVTTDKISNQARDGVILLFKVEDPAPVATWSVKKARGAEISFVETDSCSYHEKTSNEEMSLPMLAYVNGDHEYIVFDPYSEEQSRSQSRKSSSVAIEEAGNAGYLSIYGELPQRSSQTDKTPLAPFTPSNKLVETLFGDLPSHAVEPPLTKLCLTFLESLLEKIPRPQD